jgi:hypothetical protein
MKEERIICILLVIYSITIVSFSGCIGPTEGVYTTGWNYSGISGTSVTMGGNIVAPLYRGNDFRGYIYYDTTNHGSRYNSYRFHCGPVTPLYLLKLWSCTAHNLDRGTTYYYIAVAEYIPTGARGVGSVHNFLCGQPLGSTLDPTNIGIDSATLSGEVTHLGGASSCKVWFKYGHTGNMNKKTPEQTLTSAGKFTATVSGLESCEEYSYIVYVKNDITTYSGGIKSFIPGQVYIVLDGASDITQTSAKLNGNLTMLAGASSSQVWFEWGSTESLGHETPKIEMSSKGLFSQSITGLSTNTTYYFRACGDNSVCPVFCTDIKSFKTMS